MELVQHRGACCSLTTVRFEIHFAGISGHLRSLRWTRSALSRPSPLYLVHHAGKPNISLEDEQLSLRQIIDSSPALLHTARPDDNGPGVDDPERIFDAFMTTKGKGMRIGLAVPRSIIEAHGGRIWAENNPDGGATFSVTIPLSLFEHERAELKAF